MKGIIIFAVITGLIMIIVSSWLVNRKAIDLRYSNSKIKQIQINDNLTLPQP